MDTTTNQAVYHLQALGFNESEALAYTALVREGPLTGYQLAKSSGVARPNVYAVIDRLEKRGAITRVGIGDGVKYAALPAGDLLARVSSGVDAHLAAARDALSKVSSAPGQEYVCNVVGYDNVLERAEAIVNGAKQRLLVGVWSNESLRLSEAVMRAQARGVDLVTLCIQGCADECGGCRGEIYRYAIAGESATRWLMLVADERELLMGEITAAGNAQAAHTTLPMIVAIGGQYLRHTIATAEITRSLGPKLPGLLDREAVRAIDGSTLASDGTSWFKQLLTAVRSSRR
jgi:hypothetical protein